MVRIYSDDLSRELDSAARASGRHRRHIPRNCRPSRSSQRVLSHMSMFLASIFHSHVAMAEASLCDPMHTTALFYFAQRKTETTHIFPEQSKIGPRELRQDQQAT